MGNLGNGQMNLIGGGNAISFAGTDTIEEATRKLAAEQFNAKQKQVEEAKRAQIEEQIREATKNKERAETLEIAPLGAYILVKLYDQNPYDTLKVSDSGLILPSFEGRVFDKESGTEKTLDKVTEIAHVIEVGPDVTYVREGDDIMFRAGGQSPIPFLRQGFWVIHQNNVLVTINEGLQARFAEIKEG